MRYLVTALLAGAALLPLPARAQDLTQLQAQLQAMQAEVARLSAQVAELQAQESAKPTPAPLPAAIASPALAPAAAAARPAAVPAWVANTTISGKAFANLSTIDQKSDGVAAAPTGTQAELKRFYIGIDHRFDDTFSTNITTDFRYNANGTSRDGLLYVKKAYLQAKLAPEFIVRLGSADLPWIPFVEGVYGYRFVETTLSERPRFGTSADWGVHVSGALANNLVSYAVSAVNGAGYKTLSRSSDTIDLEGRVSVNPMAHVVLAVGGYTGKLGKSAANLPTGATPHRATRLDALAGYTGSRVRLGVEYFSASNWNNVTTIAADKSDGWSAFGSFAAAPNIIVFGRYDWVRPAKLTNAAERDNYFNVGVDYKPLKPLDLALVYKRDAVERGLLNTTNGLIGGVTEGTYDEFGLFTQLQF